MSVMDDFMFTAIPIIVCVMFAVILTIFIIAIILGVKGWHNNNKAPRITAFAKVVSRRMQTSHSMNDTSHSASTTYFVTFEFESGDRLELLVPTQDYGYIIEGDSGKLEFQGTRFLSFERS